jgi:hypothetical protein
VVIKAFGVKNSEEKEKKRKKKKKKEKLQCRTVASNYNFFNVCFCSLFRLVFFFGYIYIYYLLYVCMYVCIYDLRKPTSLDP